MRPAGYVAAWIQFAEAVTHVQQIADCTRRDAVDAVMMALQDGHIASRYSDTGDEINKRDWFSVAFVAGKLLLGADRRPVELRREDIEKLWPDPTATCRRTPTTPQTSCPPVLPQKRNFSKPATEGKIHRAIGEAYDAAAGAGEKPPNLREITAPVQAILRKVGYEASGKQIQALAGHARHGGRRRREERPLRAKNASNYSDFELLGPRNLEIWTFPNTALTVVLASYWRPGGHSGGCTTDFGSSAERIPR